MRDKINFTKTTKVDRFRTKKNDYPVVEKFFADMGDACAALINCPISALDEIYLDSDKKELMIKIITQAIKVCQKAGINVEAELEEMSKDVFADELDEAATDNTEEASPEDDDENKVQN